jgi:catechol 2,3-dioxygenase-like lactoylglutathione lyase family enzyme
MPIRTLDHVNIRTGDVARSCDFYGSLLGLKVTALPGSADLSLGAWLCDNAERPVVHVVSTAAHFGDGADAAPAATGSGAVHHVAFECTDYHGMLSKIRQHGLSPRTNEVAAIALRQIFVADPNGILVELNFRDPPVSNA